MNVKVLVILIGIVSVIANEAIADPYQKFVLTHTDALTKQYENYLNDNVEGKTIESFISTLRSEWGDIYDNQPLELSDNECIFWIAASQLQNSYTDYLQDLFKRDADFIYNLLKGKISLPNRFRDSCRVWYLDSITTSMIKLFAAPEKYDGQRISVKAFVKNNYLFLTSEHMKFNDLSNSLFINDRMDSDVSKSLVGKMVWLEGRFYANKCNIQFNNGCLKMIRVIRIEE
jgi:ubiquitin-protein ligase